MRGDRGQWSEVSVNAKVEMQNAKVIAAVKHNDSFRIYPKPRTLFIEPLT
jgi:hypothetical protein